MKLLYQTLTIILTLTPVLTLKGQESGNIDHSFINAISPWLQSDNAAGLCAMPVNRSGFVNAHFGKQNGGLCGINDSADSFDAGAQTETFVKVSERLHLFGNLDYNNFQGKDMGGPVFMDPSYNSINFYEFADTTLGRRTKETYHLSGGISYNFNNKWSIGAKVDYTDADRTKIKDPRYLTVWMDFGASAGFRFAPTDAFSIGLNFKYRRTLEQIDAEIVGVTGEKYFTYIDMGGFYGTRELLNESSGYLSESETRPMFNTFYGGALQIEAGRDTKIFNEISFLRRGGYYGKKSSTSVTFTEHSGNIIEYRGVLVAGKGDNRHRVGLDFCYESLDNLENIYRMSAQTGQYTVVEYFGQNEVLNRTDMNFGLSYTGYTGISNFRPTWEFGIAADWHNRSSLTTIYPFYRSYTLMTLHGKLFGKRNIVIKNKNILMIEIQGHFNMGLGNPKTDGTLAGTNSKAPLSADLYLDKDFEYKTAMQAGGLMKLRYTRLFKKIGAYVEVADSFTHLLKKPEFLKGSYRNILETKIGITF